MKKIISILTFAVLLGTFAFAQKDFNSAQFSLRSDVVTYLKSEGFQPSIDDDGDIMFKRQGDTYFVIISATDDNPMYIQLAKYFNYNDSFTRTKATLLANEISLYKMCKLTASENKFSLACQMFVRNSSAFTSTFYRMLEVMDAAESELSN